LGHQYSQFLALELAHSNERLSINYLGFHGSRLAFPENRRLVNVEEADASVRKDTFLGAKPR
jgi:hypothetical protein